MGCPTRRVYVWGFWSHCSQSLSADRIDCDQPRLAICIERPTAPRPGTPRFEVREDCLGGQKPTSPGDFECWVPRPCAFCKGAVFGINEPDRFLGLFYKRK